MYQLPFGRHRKYGANVNDWLDAAFGGWQINGIYRVDDGLPIQLALCGGCSVNLPTYGNQFPDLLAPLNVAGTGNLNQYFANPQVAVKPAPYTDGDAPRVLPNARMPGTDNLTASLFKEIPLGFREGARLDIRLEAFNVFNRVQFAAARYECRRRHLRPDHRASQSAAAGASRTETLLLRIGRMSWTPSRTAVLLNLAIAVACSLMLAGCRAGKPAPPSIEFSRIPSGGEGSPDKLEPIEGRVRDARPGERIVLFALSGVWWVQPFATEPFTAIQPDAKWKNSTHPGSAYAALLVESRYRPPLTLSTLPEKGGPVLAVATIEGTESSSPGRTLQFSGYQWEVRETASDHGGSMNYL